MKTFAEISDEHGEVIDPAFPAELIHDEDSCRRWQICEGLAKRVTGNGPWGEVVAMAESIFHSDIPTDEENWEEPVDAAD